MGGQCDLVVARGAAPVQRTSDRHPTDFGQGALNPIIRIGRTRRINPKCPPDLATVCGIRPDVAGIRTCPGVASHRRCRASVETSYSEITLSKYRAANRGAAMNLGSLSVSLAVKVIGVSKTFYEKLGFEAVGGDVAENWLILKNGDHVLGLNIKHFWPKTDFHCDLSEGLLVSRIYINECSTIKRSPIGHGFTAKQLSRLDLRFLVGHRSGSHSAPPDPQLPCRDCRSRPSRLPSCALDRPHN